MNNINLDFIPFSEVKSLLDDPAVQKFLMYVFCMKAGEISGSYFKLKKFPDKSIRFSLSEEQIRKTIDSMTKIESQDDFTQ